MQINIFYSPDREQKRVENTLKRMPWYTKHGYVPLLPEGIKVSATKEEIVERIHSVFQEEDYVETASQLRSIVDRFQDTFALELEKIFPGEVPQYISLIITKYGVGGSYVTPDTLFYNKSTAPGFDTIFHEIVHLCVEPYIQKYGIAQWEKERIVDLILHLPQFSLIYPRWQKGYQNVERYVDELFYEFFLNNREEFFRQIILKRESHMG